MLEQAEARARKFKLSEQKREEFIQNVSLMNNMLNINTRRAVLQNASNTTDVRQVLEHKSRAHHL